MDTVGSRVQSLALDEQIVVLARLAQDRAENGLFAPKDIDGLCDEIGLPRPRDVADPAAARIFRKVEELLV